MKPLNSKIFVSVLAVGAAGAFTFWLGGKSIHTGTSDAAESASAAVETAAIAEMDLGDALRAEVIELVLKGNGRERMAMAIRNRGSERVKLVVPAGQIFTSAETAVILLRSREIELGERETLRLALETAAVRAGSPVGDASFSLSDGTMPKLDSLIRYLGDHPEISTAAAQTAVLALTDNLPVGAFATFAPVGGDMPSILDTTPFRVEVADILSALLVLREVGVPPETLALTVDPQLRIEAMIDPLAHALAMRYYGITSSREWEYWKWELSKGDEATRHYALFGIARFFPDVAVEMLPRWVRETRTNEVFRTAALQALAETDRPETSAILEQLASELGSGSVLGRIAQEAIQHVSVRMQSSESPKVAIAFRTGNAGL